MGFTETDGIQTDHAASNETSLVMSINSKLVDIENLNQDEIPVAIWGKDPREAASVEYGTTLIEKNVEKVAESLKNIVEPAGEFTEIRFCNVKNLLG